VTDPSGTAAERGCALVTGASRGIGASIACGLAADGWAVGVNYRVDEQGAGATVERIRSAGGDALAVEADVSDPDAVDGLCAQVEDHFERPILVLVNNACASANGMLALMPDDSWQRVVDTNLSAAFRLSRRVVRTMVRERFGRVVNIASVAAWQAPAGQANYVASKAGLIGLTKGLAVEVAPRSVTVNAIAPGLVDTDRSGPYLERLVGSVPLGRVGTLEEVAACARFLVSEQASYVTGSVLTVDGGLSA
jgi:3-oxoacyl-[acyl-carrier protein] reductase